MFTRLFNKQEQLEIFIFIIYLLMAFLNIFENFFPVSCFLNIYGTEEKKPLHNKVFYIEYNSLWLVCIKLKCNLIKIIIFFVIFDTLLETNKINFLQSKLSNR